jgi:hypothetical protein
MVSTIAVARKLIQSGTGAIFGETQQQKRTQIRRIFSVAQMTGTA